ncbi:MAG TPA: 30S ribosomal protein S3 [Patescibacteria group bacterium]|uniref:Small ribosomal subunit protein uS3 n=1 Tax=uncultured Berkelbacteria bacterium Rifle_16ft_4_minimus_38443 TaxID=1665092 RepID=A0A0H4T7B6_9BACT|nr:30S ribosomal protein S3, small subunit ribosomal protein S3 [uncultured Berkelbacteria bacterium Rifle_16ft_4_minimus_38443]HLC38641.1 30S ribosomal protein S3 [Patescibacteria group bacterium]
MGQKVNPESLRLPLNKNWHSKWYSKKNYPQIVMEDLNIRKEIKAKFSLGTIELIEIVRERGGDIKILIYTPKPGVLIGRSGKGTEDLKNYLDKKIGKKVKIEIFEVHDPDTRAQIIAENIAFQLARRVAYRRAVNMAIERAKDAGAIGIKIEIGGRLNGAEIARREKFGSGSIPTQTLKIPLDFAKVDAFTKYGTIGIKVWVYKKIEENNK